jgi:hypothetical protein
MAECTRLYCLPGEGRVKRARGKLKKPSRVNNSHEMYLIAATCLPHQTIASVSTRPYPFEMVPARRQFDLVSQAHPPYSLYYGHPRGYARHFLSNVQDFFDVGEMPGCMCSPGEISRPTVSTCTGVEFETVWASRCVLTSRGLRGGVPGGRTPTPAGVGGGKTPAQPKVLHSQRAISHTNGHFQLNTPPPVSTQFKRKNSLGTHQIRRTNFVNFN